MLILRDIKMNFSDLGLSEKTIKAIDEIGIKEPTTVQADVIPSILEGKDVFTIAPQGCGKTMSYVLPLLDIISNKKAQTILIITPNSNSSVMVSDQLAIFNKYHSENEEDIENEANVIIGSPDLLLEVIECEKADITSTNILVVDDINLIKKNKQLDNLEKILSMLPAEKQNIVYTNRRSKETQSVLEKILKAPEEIKVDKDKEKEAQRNAVSAHSNLQKNKSHQQFISIIDDEAVKLAKKTKAFNNKVPEFILIKGILAEDNKDQ